MLPCGSDHIFAPVAFVGEHFFQGRIPALCLCNHIKACLAVVDICTSGMGMKQIALTVNNNMAFYTFDLLEAVNSLDRVRQPAGSACTVYEADCRRGIPSKFPSGIFKKKTMDFVEYAFGIPVSPFVINRFPVRITYGQKPPLATTSQKVEYRLKNTDGVMRSFAFHQIRKESDQGVSFSPVNLGNVYERIIISFYQAAV